MDNRPTTNAAQLTNHVPIFSHFTTEDRGGGRGSGSGGGGGGGNNPNRQGQPPLGPRLPLAPPPDGQPDDDDPEGEPDDACFDAKDDRAPRRAKSIKEADELKLQSLPAGQAYRTWRMSALHAIVAAAGRHDDQLMALLRVEKSETVEELSHPGRNCVSRRNCISRPKACVSRHHDTVDGSRKLESTAMRLRLVVGNTWHTDARVQVCMGCTLARRAP
jgi:hypothetical protein